MFTNASRHNPKKVQVKFLFSLQNETWATRISAAFKIMISLLRRIYLFSKNYRLWGFLELSGDSSENFKIICHFMFFMISLQFIYWTLAYFVEDSDIKKCILLIIMNKKSAYDCASFVRKTVRVVSRSMFSMYSHSN